MLSVLLASVAIGAGHSGGSVVCEHLPPGSKVALLVERAWQEAATDPQDPRHLADLQNDMKMGKEFSELIEKEIKLSEDQETTQRVQRIGAELSAIANKTLVTVSWGDKRLNPFDYTFKLIEDKDINAFSLPGGFIYINDGLIKYSESDDEVAGVLAHEIAHASFRHVATLRREQSRLQNIQLPLILIALLTGGARGAAETAQVTQLAGIAIGSGWSVQAEQAADFGGFQYMLRSKYDATGMLTLMERLARDARTRPRFDEGIFRTHPPSRDRANALMKSMREAGVPIRRSRVASSFRTTSEAVEGTDKIAISFGSRKIVEFAGPEAAERAAVATERLNWFFDSMPELYDLDAGANGTIIGKRQVILEIKPEDAVAANMTVRALQADSVRNLRTAIFNQGYRVWDVR
jgi:beta-barrel assembly-enhancing protease